MPVKPKEKEKKGKKEPETGDEASWANDQQKKDYYYDDSHGYEIFDPEDEHENDDEGKERADVITFPREKR